jgi:hypothetical protein
MEGRIFIAKKECMNNINAMPKPTENFRPLGKCMFCSFYNLCLPTTHGKN